MAYYVPSTPPIRGRAYSFSQPSQQYYPPTPYSGNTLTIPYTPGISRSANYYVAPTVSGRRSRSHSRPRHSHSHHRSHHHQYHSGHGHSRRSHSVGAHRNHLHRPSVHYASQRPHTGTNYSRHYNSPSLGSRILSFFGLGNSNRYVDQQGRTVDSRSRGRAKYKY